MNGRKWYYSFAIEACRSVKFSMSYKALKEHEELLEKELKGIPYIGVNLQIDTGIMQQPASFLI